MHKWRLDRLLFPGIVRRGNELLKYAKRQTQLRQQADQGRKDFFWYIANAKNKDGSPAYEDPREVWSEARTLMIGGMLTLSSNTCF